jgi:hypothetical protein
MSIARMLLVALLLTGLAGSAVSVGFAQTAPAPAPDRKPP